MSETIERERDPLVDHAALAVHQNLLNVLAERVSVANGLRNKAQAAYDEAQDKYQAAVFGRGGDAHELKLALENAARRLAVESERADAARAELQHANALTDTVRAIAHKPVHESHMRNWRDDVKRRDAAVAVLAGIDADIAADIAGMRACNSIGLPDIHGLLQSHELPKTARDLRAHFEARYIEWDDPKHPARMPPERLTDEQARAQGLVKMAKGEDVTHVHPSAVAAHVASGWSA
jgi:hypothetical protein